MDTGPKLSRKINPRYKANIISILTFGWTLETFKLGYTKNIEDADLYAPLPEHRSDVLGDIMQKTWENEVDLNRHRNNNSKPSLWKVLFRVFGCQFIFYGLILAGMEFLIRLQQPLFLGLLLRYYSPIQDFHNSTVNNTYFSRLLSYYDTEGRITWGEAVFFSFGVVFCSALNIMVQHPFMMAVMHIGMKMRVGLCSLIYRKVLKASIQSLSEENAGLVVNLMANDVNRFDSGPLFAHYLWIGPMETLLMTVYLYREVGWAAVYGALIIVAVVPFQIFLGTRTAYYRRGIAIKSDERVKLMKEIVMGIEVIKMYTWEKPFRKIIDVARREEIYIIKRASYIRGIILSFIMFTSRFGIFITILFFVTNVSRITVETVFFLTCYYNIMKQTMTLYFPQAVGQIAEMKVAVQRIRDYLLTEECEISQNEITEPVLTTDSDEQVAIVMEPENRRTQVNVDKKPNDPEITKSNQQIKDAAILFEDASSRWLRSSDKDDVKNVNLTIYSKSLTSIIGAVGSGKSTLLHMALGELPCSNGSMKLSGTVSYASQEPWLFVGSIRQNILFGQPFVKARYMNVCKVCALERDISLFPHGDKTVVGERGVSLSGGQRARINLARAVYKEADIYLLDDPLSAVDTQVAKHIFERCIKKYLEQKTVVLVTHQLQFIKSIDKVVVMDKGRILTEGSYESLKEQKPPIIQLMENQTREVHEDNGSITSQNISISRAISTMSLHKRQFSLSFEGSNTDQRPEREFQMKGRVDSSIYREYFLAGASKYYALFVLLLFIFAQICASASDYWISRWSIIEDQLTGDSTVDNVVWLSAGLQRYHYVLIFGLITLSTIIAALLRSYTFFTLCMHSSVNLHDKMFNCISKCPMMFFHKNSSGRILNRFSKDMGAVDELLPQAMIDCFQILLNLLGVVGVILLIDITLLIPILAAMMIFYIFRIIFIRTSGAVKRLEGITRSPVFGHLNATVSGLATIRSFGAETLLVQEFDRHQDLHSAAWYLFITCSRAFGYYLDIICLLFIICVTFGCLMKTEYEASYIGLIITQSISLTGIFQWGMRQSAEMENQMTSVERILEYVKLPTEIELNNPQKPPENWPTKGTIQFVNLNLKYAPNDQYVLKDLDFAIGSSEKIGIVGRTGAGKSSIIQALFRLALTEGTIIIDDVDISTIELCDLREKISIIPQEPVLFSGTMRKNLDPFHEYPDDTLLEALKSVELITENEGKETLDKQVLEGGSNFSVGERQLVCLARAIVRKNRILLLDEATANVDAQTDALIQTTIRNHFTTCTVLTIAHRLNTVIDSDKILVLDAGRLLEYDHPHMLLKNKKSFFRSMVMETGASMAPLLYKLAAENYKKMKMQEKQEINK